MSLKDSAEFQQLRASLYRLKADLKPEKGTGEYDVFVISRFNGDDNTLRPYLSTSYSDKADTTLYPVEKRQLAKGGAIVTSPANQQHGGHAEEKFIRSLNELAGLFGAPSRIDVYVSRIPCAGRSKYWNAHKPFEEENMIWPAGCGPKLFTAIKATPHITWTLVYEEIYEKEGIQASSMAEVDKIAGLPNATVGRFHAN